MTRRSHTCTAIESECSCLCGNITCEWLLEFSKGKCICRLWGRLRVKQNCYLPGVLFCRSWKVEMPRARPKISRYLLDTLIIHSDSIHIYDSINIIKFFAKCILVTLVVNLIFVVVIIFRLSPSKIIIKRILVVIILYLLWDTIYL